MVTKFEPKFAHTFLPCWDDPYIKTTFNVSILHDKKYNMVLSNMPIQSQQIETFIFYNKVHKQKSYFCSLFKKPLAKTKTVMKLQVKKFFA